MIEAYLLSISGKVQKVWYRASTQQKAKELGITGWVKNEANGDVTAWIEGNVSAVNQLIIWCLHGPESAKVDKLIIESKISENFNEFTILR